MPTPTTTVHTHSNSASRRGRIELRATSLRKEFVITQSPQGIVIKQSRKVHSSPDKAANVIFCHTNVSHTIGKYSTRPHDTTRSNLTGSKSRRAAGSAGAAQKSALHRDQRLFAATARIDPAITGLRCPARSAGSGDVRGDSRPLDRADPAATACDHVLTAGMPLERAGCRPASAASHFLSPD